MIEYSPELIPWGKSLVDELNADAELTDQLASAIPSFQGLQYYPGHVVEIMNTIQKKDKSDSLVYQKYPAVFFFLDAAEQHGRGGAYNAPSLQIMIANYTQSQYSSLERHELVFVPILLPIYWKLIQAISNSSWVIPASEERVLHDKINRYFYGSALNEKNPFNDHLDTIEIRNLQLKFNFLNCQQ